MVDPYRVPGEKVSKLALISEKKVLMMFGIPSLALVILGFIACVGFPRVIEAQKYDPTKDTANACKDSIAIIGSGDRCNHPEHVSAVLLNKENDPRWLNT